MGFSGTEIVPVNVSEARELPNQVVFECHDGVQLDECAAAELEYELITHSGFVAQREANRPRAVRLSEWLGVNRLPLPATTGTSNFMENASHRDQAGCTSRRSEATGKRAESGQAGLQAQTTAMLRRFFRCRCRIKRQRQRRRDESRRLSSRLLRRCRFSPCECASTCELPP